MIVSGQKQPQHFPFVVLSTTEWSSAHVLHDSQKGTASLESRTVAQTSRGSPRFLSSFTWGITWSKLRETRAVPSSWQTWAWSSYSGWHPLRAKVQFPGWYLWKSEPRTSAVSAACLWPSLRKSSWYSGSNWIRTIHRSKSSQLPSYHKASRSLHLPVLLVELSLLSQRDLKLYRRGIPDFVSPIQRR